MQLSWIFPLVCSVWIGDQSFDRPPIEYANSKPNDAIAKLQRQIDRGEVTLDFDSRSGYLESLLAKLRVPVSSQGLVFSKTSFQLKRISPATPRAVYFNDDVYVGYVCGGDVLEVSAADPVLGGVFYTLSQDSEARPQFVRRTGECLTCHASAKTFNVPGHLMRSVYPDRDGFPLQSVGGFQTNHDSPLQERFGGWLVSGTHGKQRHMGNAVTVQSDQPTLDMDLGANISDLRSRFDSSGYLSSHSDVVALMVLAHQAHMHNLITHANQEARSALWYQESVDRALGRSAGVPSETTVRRLDNAAESLLRYILFMDEPALDERVTGTTDFAAQFSTQGPFDHSGRSLRMLDLERRLFKYPCSYLIYSEAFDALPAEVKSRFYRRLWEILTSRDRRPEYAMLAADRRAVPSILRDTKTDLPDYWYAE